MNKDGMKDTLVRMKLDCIKSHIDHVRTQFKTHYDDRESLLNVLGLLLDIYILLYREMPDGEEIELDFETYDFIYGEDQNVEQ